MPRPGRAARVVPRLRRGAGIARPSLGGAGPPALGRRRCAPLAYGFRCAPAPAARPARRSHRRARSRRRFGCAQRQTPRTLAPAEHKARATIKSKSYKKQAQPKRSHRRTRIKAKRKRRSPSLDARAIPPTIPGLGQKQKQQQKQKQGRALRARPSAPVGGGPVTTLRFASGASEPARARSKIPHRARGLWFPLIRTVFREGKRGSRENRRAAG
jgi:hypothetical protein